MTSRIVSRSRPISEGIFCLIAMAATARSTVEADLVPPPLFQPFSSSVGYKAALLQSFVSKVGPSTQYTELNTTATFEAPSLPSRSPLRVQTVDNDQITRPFPERNPSRDDYCWCISCCELLSAEPTETVDPYTPASGKDLDAFDIFSPLEPIVEISRRTSIVNDIDGGGSPSSAQAPSLTHSRTASGSTSPSEYPLTPREVPAFRDDYFRLNQTLLVPSSSSSVYSTDAVADGLTKSRDWLLMTEPLSELNEEPTLSVNRQPSTSDFGLQLEDMIMASIPQGPTYEDFSNKEVYFDAQDSPSRSSSPYSYSYSRPTTAIPITTTEYFERSNEQHQQERSPAAETLVQQQPFLDRPLPPLPPPQSQISIYAQGTPVPEVPKARQLETTSIKTLPVKHENCMFCDPPSKAVVPEPVAEIPIQAPVRTPTATHINPKRYTTTMSFYQMVTMMEEVPERMSSLKARKGHRRGVQSA